MYDDGYRNIVNVDVRLRLSSPFFPNEREQFGSLVLCGPH